MKTELKKDKPETTETKFARLSGLASTIASQIRHARVCHADEPDDAEGDLRQTERDCLTLFKQVEKLRLEFVEAKRAKATP